MEKKKQKVISLIEEMDEDELDKLLYFIKCRPKKKKGKNIISSKEAKEVWKDVSMIIEKDLTEVSYKTWIKTIIPVSIEGEVFTLAVENEFQLNIIESRYSNLIKRALLYVVDRKFELKYVIRGK